MPVFAHPLNDQGVAEREEEENHLEELRRGEDLGRGRCHNGLIGTHSGKHSTVR